MAWPAPTHLSASARAKLGPGRNETRRSGYVPALVFPFASTEFVFFWSADPMIEMFTELEWLTSRWLQMLCYHNYFKYIRERKTDNQGRRETKLLYLVYVEHRPRNAKVIPLTHPKPEPCSSQGANQAWKLGEMYRAPLLLEEGQNLLSLNQRSSS